MAKLNASGVFAWQRVRHVLKFNKVKYGYFVWGPLECRSKGKQKSLVTCVVPYPGDGGGGVDEHRVPVATLLSLIEGVECLVDGEGLRVKDLLVGLEMEAASGSPDRKSVV